MTVASSPRFAALVPALTLAAALAATPASAQLALPRPSHGAKVSATVGITEVTVDYSAPGVKGRKIFGELLPFGKVWRAGANQATKLTFSTDALLGGKKVPAGTYSVFVVPTPTEWTVILNKDVAATEQSYKTEGDVARVQAMPQAIPMRERLGFEILDATEAGARLSLEWEKVRVAVPFTVDTQGLVLASIRALKSEDWKPYNGAARWLLDSKLEAALALSLADKSIALKEEWLNQWTRAELLAAKGDKPGALAAATKAQELGKKAGDGFFWADKVAKALTDWK